MAQTEINSLFTSGGVPVENIIGTTPGYPSVRVWEIDGNINTLIIGAGTGVGLPVDGVMTELTTGSPATGDGFYTFLFTDLIGYDETKKYLIRTDGGPALNAGERYQVAEIEPLVDAITNAVWDEQLAPDHQITGSTGLTLSQIKADTTQAFLELDGINDLINLLLKYDTNRTKIDDVANTLTVYDDDCTTVLRVFQLLDENGVPSTESVCERKPISASDGKSVCP